MLEANVLFQKILNAGIFAEIPQGSVENSIRLVTALLNFTVAVELAKLTLESVTRAPWISLSFQ